MPNSYPIPGHILFTKLPNSVTQEKLLNLLPQELVEKISRVHLFKEEHSAVIEVLDYEMVDQFLQNPSIPLESGGTILVSYAYLILSLPKYDRQTDRYVSIISLLSSFSTALTIYIIHMYMLNILVLQKFVLMIKRS